MWFIAQTYTHTKTRRKIFHITARDVFHHLKFTHTYIQNADWHTALMLPIKKWLIPAICYAELNSIDKTRPGTPLTSVTPLYTHSHQKTFAGVGRLFVIMTLVMFRFNFSLNVDKLQSAAPEKTSECVSLNSRILMCVRELEPVLLLPIFVVIFSQNASGL